MMKILGANCASCVTVWPGKVKIISVSPALKADNQGSFGPRQEPHRKPAAKRPPLFAEQAVIARSGGLSLIV